MKKTAIISILMILLVVSMPMAFASGILSYEIHGQDGINKVVRSEDVLEVEAVVSVTGDSEVTPDQVWLGSNIQFDTCELDINGYLCKLSYPKQGDKDFMRKEPFTINLHNDDHANPPLSFSLVAAQSGYMVVDTHPPRVDVDLDATRVADQIGVSFEAYDDSYAIGNYEECAGLQTIHFYTAGEEINTIFDYDVNECYADEDFNIDVSAVPEGQYTLVMDAVDHMGNSVTVQFNIEVDRSGAGFSNLRVLDGNGEEITHIANDFIDATVLIDVSDDVKANTIKADLSSLNDKSSYHDMPGSCYNDEGVLVCEWSIEISPQVYGTRNLIFQGEDNIGNYNEKDITKVLQRDIEGPRAISLTTGLSTYNINYLRPNNNTIEVVFTEGGAGLDADDVLLDISSLGGYNGLKASYCEQGWKCVWEGLNFAIQDGRYNISVNPSTKDKLGNVLKTSFSGEVVLDTSSSQIVSVELNPIGGGLVSYEGFLTYGDSLQIIAQVYEPGMIADAYADFSAMINDAYLVQADDCDDTGDGIWECTWITNPIDLTGHIRDDIELTFRDYLGNTMSYKTEVTIYGLEDSSTNYWSHEVQCSPPAVDKEVASLVDQRVYCNVHLKGNAQIVSMGMEECTGNGSAKYVRTEELLNAQAGSTDPYIKLTLNAAEIAEDSLKLTCPLIIISKSGNSITSIPEREEIDIEVGLYNLPLGEYGKNMQGKIDDAVDDATGGIWKVMTAMNKLFFYGERICSLLTTINNMASLFQSIGMVWDTVANTLSGVNPPAAATADEVRKGEQTVAEVLNNKMKEAWLFKEKGFMNKFCKFISCRLFYDGDGWMGEIGEKAGNFQKDNLELFNNIATLGGVDIPFVGRIGDKGVNAYTYTEGTEERGGIGKQVFLQGGKLNPKDSIVMSFATLCIPGIVYNLDKYRQIKCMYADCLQSSIETGVPAYACEDAKEYETCKYVYGEIFQLLPFTGLLNYFVGLVKGVLYNPLGVVDLFVSKMYCMRSIKSPLAGKAANICLFKEVAGLIADIWSDLSNIKDDWKIKMDYCSRLDEGDDDDDGDKKSGLGGLFS